MIDFFSGKIILIVIPLLTHSVETPIFMGELRVVELTVDCMVHLVILCLIGVEPMAG